MTDCVPEIRTHEIPDLQLRNDTVICPNCESPLTQIVDDESMICMYCGNIFDREPEWQHKQLP